MKTPESHIKYADLLNTLKRPVMAEEEARKALAIDPYHAGAHASLAQALFRQERLRAALFEIREGLAIQPEWPWAHVFHGVVLDKLKLYKSAESAFRTALRLEPHNADFWADFAAFLNNADRFRAAQHAALSGLQADPEHVACRLICATAALNEGNKDSVLEWIDEALAREPENAEAHWLKGLVLWQRFCENFSGDPTGALSHMKEALKLDPGNTDWQSQIKRTEYYLQSSDFKQQRILFMASSTKLWVIAILGFFLLILLWVKFIDP